MEIKTCDHKPQHSYHNIYIYKYSICYPTRNYKILKTRKEFNVWKTIAKDEPPVIGGIKCSFLEKS